MCTHFHSYQGYTILLIKERILPADEYLQVHLPQSKYTKNITKFSTTYLHPVISTQGWMLQNQKVNLSQIAIKKLPLIHPKGVNYQAWAFQLLVISALYVLNVILDNADSFQQHLTFIYETKHRAITGYYLTILVIAFLMCCKMHIPFCTLLCIHCTTQTMKLERPLSFICCSASVILTKTDILLQVPNVLKIIHLR